MTATRSRFPAAGLALVAALIAGCAGLPPGAGYPRTATSAIPAPEGSALGRSFAAASRDHGDRSAFHLLNNGVDGLLTRVQMIDAAEISVDAQYFIFRADASGRLVLDALQRAAARGVRVRVLVDDADTVPGDEKVAAIGAQPGVEVRIFNPFAYRGHSRLRRGAEFLFNMRRLDYRMHNKLLIVDNAVALIGGRNIGNQYFQVDPEGQFADDDVFSAGPVVQKLSAVFDGFWNSRLAIPVAALHAVRARAPRGGSGRHAGARRVQALDPVGVDYAALIDTGEPYASLVSARLPLIWAGAQVVADSPYKRDVVQGRRRGRLMAEPVAAAVAGVKSELLMITPYFLPARDEMMQLLGRLDEGARVAVLTNSMMSTPELFVQAAYSGYRRPLLDAGADLYEIRARIGNPRGSGQTARISSFGTYSLHAKLFVFDRERVFIGSMNYDRRSLRLNTEIGLIVDSPELAQLAANRFELMTRPESAYALSLRGGDAGGALDIVWDTVENSRARQYSTEPARSGWQRLRARLLGRLPDDGEL
jgi:putative cardiolipin synthase